MDTSQTNPFDQFDEPTDTAPKATTKVAQGVNPFDQFDEASAQQARAGATGSWEDESRAMSLSSETATRVPKIPGTEFIAEAITTPLDLIDMGVGVFGLIGKTLEQGGLALYEHGKAALKGETIDPEAMKNISGFMAEEFSKPEMAASLAPVRTMMEQSGNVLPETPITRVFGGVSEAIEKGSEAAEEATGTEAMKYGLPMVAEGLMALGAAHGLSRGQTKKAVHQIRAKQINEAKAAGLTTNEMAETILKKAAKEGIEVPPEMKGKIKVTLDQLAEAYDTTVDYTGKSAKAAAAATAKLNEAMAPFERRATPRVQPSLLVEPRQFNDVGLVPQVQGVHYSPTQRPILSGRFYGTVVRGAERVRLAKAEDPRIKSRVTFYVDEGKGTFPEQGVGKYAHEVPLNNLYDAAKNPLKLPAEPNAFESAVIDAGFDGYYMRGAFDRQGAAVILGDAAKEIKVPKKVEPSFEVAPRVDAIPRITIGLGSIVPKVIAEGKPLFRETSTDGLTDILREDYHYDTRTMYVTDDPTLALGQGVNKGVIIKFRANSLSGQEKGKPGTGVIGGREYTTDVTAPQAIAEITFKRAKDLEQIKGLTARTLRTEFTKVGNLDGSITLTRKVKEPSAMIESHQAWIQSRTYEVPKARALAESEVIISLPEGLQKAAKQMIERSKKGLRGGLIIDVNENLNYHFAERLTKYTGRPKEVELEWVQKTMPQIPGAERGGFYDPNTGTTFLNASSKRAAVDRLLHEISHASDNPTLNMEIMSRLMDTKLPDDSGLYSRVRMRMQQAQVQAVPTEATAYLVSEVMRMGRQAGFSRLDTGFWQWATKALPAETLNWLKDIVANVRAAMYKYGAALKESELTPDDILALTKSNMRDIAKGKLMAVEIQDRGIKITQPNKEMSQEIIRKGVEKEKQLEDFKPEKIEGLLNKDGWAILTAENPKGKALTPAENTHRMAAMRAELDAAGIEHHAATGNYGGNKEHSVVLTNVTKEQAREIADRWDQETVLVKEGLLYSDGSINPAKGIKKLKSEGSAEGDVKLGLIGGYTHVSDTGATFLVDIDFKTKIAPKGYHVTPRDEAGFAVQRKILQDIAEKELEKTTEALGKTTKAVKEAKSFIKAHGQTFKQRGAIGNIYVKTEAEAAYIASQPGVSGWRKTDRGYQVQVPLTLEEAAKLAPEDVINWSPDTVAKTDFFKKQRGAANPKLLITSGIVLGGAALGAYIAPDLDTTQGLLMGTAIGFGLTRLPQATKAISHNWKHAIKTTAVGATYATVGYVVDKENPVEGILVGSTLFGTRFLPKTKAHPEDALINARNGNIAAEKRLTAQISKAVKDVIPDKAVREELSVLLENPKFLGRTPQEKLVVDAWRGMAQSYHDIAVNENVKMGFIDGYVSHIIERNALPQSEVNRVMAELFGTGREGTGGRAKFTKERMYPTFESLEKALEGTALKLKTKDIAEITQIYSETMTRVIENQRLINNLKEATLGDIEGRNAKLLLTDSEPGYIHLSNPQLLPYFVHPDIAPALKFVFDSRNHGDITNGLIALNRATKRMNVMGSFFHAKSLLEAYALAGGNLFSAKGAIESSLKQFREGGLGDELDLGLRAGLRVELPTEVSQQALVQVGQLADYYVSKMLGTKVGVGEKALGYLEKKQIATFDKFTWDYLHTGLKTATYLRLMEDYKLGKKGQGMSEDVYRQGVASHINDTFGGLDWYRVVSEAKTEAGRKILMGALKPSARDYLGVAIFAPDWTVSTIRAMTKGLPGGSKNPANALLARQYALRTAILYGSVLVPMNYALSGHFPWDEEQKDPTRLDLGDGTNLQVVKHSMEYAEWVRDPWKTFSNKMGFLPRSFESLRYGKQYPKGPDIEGSRLGYAVSQVAPFTARAFQGDTNPETSAARALLGMFGISVYGMTEEEKEYAKEQRQLRKEQEEEE